MAVAVEKQPSFAWLLREHAPGLETSLLRTFSENSAAWYGGEEEDSDNSDEEEEDEDEVAAEPGGGQEVAVEQDRRLRHSRGRSYHIPLEDEAPSDDSEDDDGSVLAYFGLDSINTVYIPVLQAQICGGRRPFKGTVEHLIRLAAGSRGSAGAEHETATTRSSDETRSRNAPPPDTASAEFSLESDAKSPEARPAYASEAAVAEKKTKDGGTRGGEEDEERGGEDKGARETKDGGEKKGERETETPEAGEGRTERREGDEKEGEGRQEGKKQDEGHEAREDEGKAALKGADVQFSVDEQRSDLTPRVEVTSPADVVHEQQPKEAKVLEEDTSRMHAAKLTSVAGSRKLNVHCPRSLSDLSTASPSSSAYSNQPPGLIRGGSRGSALSPLAPGAWKWPSWAVDAHNPCIEVFVHGDDEEESHWVTAVPQIRVVSSLGHDALLTAQFEWGTEVYEQDFPPDQVRHAGTTESVADLLRDTRSHHHVSYLPKLNRVASVISSWSREDLAKGSSSNNIAGFVSMDSTESGGVGGASTDTQQFRHPESPTAASAHSSDSDSPGHFSWPQWALQYGEPCVDVLVEDHHSRATRWVRGRPKERVLGPHGEDVFLKVVYTWDGIDCVQDFTPGQVRKPGIKKSVLFR